MEGRVSDDQDDPEASDEERREAEALARALDGRAPAERGSLAELALRVRATTRGAAPLDPAVRRDAVGRALRAAAARRAWRVVAVAAVAVAGAVAGTAALSGPPPLRYGGPASTAFDAPFEEGAPPAERLDRLARARSRDYFAAWLERERGGDRAPGAAP